MYTASIRDPDGFYYILCRTGIRADHARPFVQGRKPYLYYAYEASLTEEQVLALGLGMVPPGENETMELRTEYGQLLAEIHGPKTMDVVEWGDDEVLVEYRGVRYSAQRTDFSDREPPFWAAHLPKVIRQWAGIN